MKKDNAVNTSVKTSRLLSRIFKASSMNQFLENNADHLYIPAFPEYISALCKQRGEVPERVIKRATLERSFGHQLFTGRRKPSRDTVLMLAFGFEADVEAAQELLKMARLSSLYPRAKRDAAVIYCLHRHMSIAEAQIILHDLDLPTLGGT